MRQEHCIAGITDLHLFTSLKKAGVTKFMDNKNKFRNNKNHTFTGDDAFIIYEDEEPWEQVKQILSIEKNDKNERPVYSSNVVLSIFTHDELLKADYIKLSTNHFTQYPQPEGGVGGRDYYPLTMDNNGCRRCFRGGSQINPYRITREPGWRGNNHFFSLWIGDALFIKKETWTQYFEPLGIEAFPVLKGARGLSELQSVVQLKIDKVSDYPLDLESYEHHNMEYYEYSDGEDYGHISMGYYEVCKKCGSKRYSGLQTGPFPNFKGDTDALIFKTQEYFGWGGASRKYIIIKPEIYRLLYENNLTKNLEFKVMGGG
ncbi:MAG: hypothetical protein KAH20_06380 [Methylococcales bacterium]|nr:hypothetical protein [Methylococcales bacterium]